MNNTNTAKATLVSRTQEPATNPECQNDIQAESLKLLTDLAGLSPAVSDFDTIQLAKEEKLLLERAAQLETDRKYLNERKQRAFLQKVEEDLKFEAERELQAFQDALQTTVEKQILEMMHEKETQLSACTTLRERLVEQCQQLQQLIANCNTKTGKLHRYRNWLRCRHPIPRIAFAN
jgi:hypothetical protein